MANKDRKDLPHPDQHGAPPSESEHDRIKRKEKESAALDEALTETFPTSDPVSPFVPAVASEPAENENPHSGICGHESCQCTVAAPEIYCSDYCRDAQKDLMASVQFCECGHAQCRDKRIGAASGS
jgi:hypothetical protein